MANANEDLTHNHTSLYTAVGDGAKVTNASGTVLSSGKVAYLTITGPGSYTAGGFTTTISGMTTVQSAVITQSGAGTGLIDALATIVSSNQVKLQCYVLATGVEVVATTNLTTDTWFCIAVGS